MLEIRANCEHCKTPLAWDAAEAMICSFECTFCEACAKELLQNVCPNCGGGFQRRPKRSARYTSKYPPVTNSLFNPVDLAKHALLVLQQKQQGHNS